MNNNGVCRGAPGFNRVIKTLFSVEWCFRANKIFSKIDCKLLLHANLTQLIGSLYLTQKRNFYSSTNIFKKF